MTLPVAGRQAVGFGGIAETILPGYAELQIILSFLKERRQSQETDIKDA